MHAPSRIEQTLTLALLALLLVGCFFVLRPFLTAILWAAIQGFFGWFYVIYYAFTRPGGLAG